MIKPLSPAEIKKKIDEAEHIPPFVIEIVNELMIASGQTDGIVLLQKDIKEAILRKVETFDIKWLNFENSYRAVGWLVMYDKPAYYENYEPSFRFNRDSSR